MGGKEKDVACNRRVACFLCHVQHSYTKITGIGIVIHESGKPQKNKNGVIIDELSESYVGIHPEKGEGCRSFRTTEAIWGKSLNIDELPKRWLGPLRNRKTLKLGRCT